MPSTEGGPWPLTIYSYGAGGYRKVSTFNNTHLTSWGFVVASVDHLERGLLARNGLLDLPDRPGGSAAQVSLTIDMLVTADDAILGGLVDGELVAFSADRVRDYYDVFEGPRQLIVLGHAGHTSFTAARGPIWDLGRLSTVGETLCLPANLLEIGENGCVPNAGFTEPAELLKLLNHLTLAHLLDVFEIEDVGEALTSTLDTKFAGLVESNDFAG
ncbi:MAG: hypothetical protein ACI9C1_002881 [Candidatus Aldehydirespiratoraceae bacterium]